MAVPTAGQHRPWNNENQDYFSVDGDLGDLIQHRSLVVIFAKNGWAGGTDTSTGAFSEVFAHSIFVTFSSDNAGGSVSYRKLLSGTEICVVCSTTRLNQKE